MANREKCIALAMLQKLHSIPQYVEDSLQHCQKQTLQSHHDRVASKTRQEPTSIKQHKSPAATQHTNMIQLASILSHRRSNKPRKS